MLITKSQSQQSNFKPGINIMLMYLSVLLRMSILGCGKCQLLITPAFPLVQWYNNNATYYHFADILHNEKLLS